MTSSARRAFALLDRTASPMDHDPPPANSPGLKQAELREAAHEGPHGSHTDGYTGPVEKHDAREHAHEAADHGAADHGPAPGDGVGHGAMGHVGGGGATTTTTR